MATLEDKGVEIVSRKKKPLSDTAFDRKIQMWGVIAPVLMGLLMCSTALFLHLRSPSRPGVVVADKSSVVRDLPVRVAARTWDSETRERQQVGIMLMSASGLLMLLMSLGRIYVHSRYRRAEISDA